MKRRSERWIGSGSACLQPQRILAPDLTPWLWPWTLLLEIEAEAAQEFAIAATGRDAERCGRLDDNLILEIYKDLLEANGRPIVPLAIAGDERDSAGDGMRVVGGRAACGHRAGGALWAARLGHGPDSRRGVRAGGASRQRGGVLAGRICERGVRGRGACTRRVSIHPPRSGGRLWRCRLSRLPPAKLARCCRPPTRWKTWWRICNRWPCLGWRLRRRGVICCGWRCKTAFTSRIARHSARCCRFCFRWSAKHGILGVALSGAGPAVLVVVEGEKSSAGSCSAIGNVTENRVAAELVICRFSRVGASQAIENK